VSGFETASRRPRRPPRRGPGPLAIAGAVALVVLSFLVGLALGRALEEGPGPGVTVTAVRTLTPVPLPPATQTVTVTGP
jgi:hypothetical protein